MASFNNASETAASIEQYYDCRQGNATIEGLTVKRRNGRIEYSLAALYTNLLTDFHADPAVLTMPILQDLSLIHI